MHLDSIDQSGLVITTVSLVLNVLTAAQADV